MVKLASKKIKCKHNLTESQEAEARQIKNKLAQGDIETLQIYRNMFYEYIKDSKGPYIDFVKAKSLVYYSALIREMERTGPKETYYKILNC